MKPAPLLSEEAVQLKEDILAQYRTLHIFCRQHTVLTRSTVYQVLSGRYPGDTHRQIKRIRDVLTTHDERIIRQVSIAELVDVLQTCKCDYCRRQDRRGCRGCRTQTGREAQALETYMATLQH